jgi:hypothetical protein
MQWEGNTWVQRAITRDSTLSNPYLESIRYVIRPERLALTWVRDRLTELQGAADGAVRVETRLQAEELDCSLTADFNSRCMNLK